MSRKGRWIQIIDANLDYLFQHQGPDGRILEESGAQPEHDRMHDD